MKKLQSLILAILWSTGIAFSASSGTCGDDLTWTLDDDGVLTISGTGKMTNYSSASDVEWYSSRTTITSVVVEESVTTIGAFAFYGCTNLSSISFGDNSQVTRIYDYSFYECTSLTSIEIPELVISLAPYAFYGCTSLTSVIFDEESVLTIISTYVFDGCTSLTDIDLPSTVTSIGNYAFYNCKSLTSIEIPSGVTSIGKFTFYCCSALTSVTFADESTLKTVGYGAFGHCTKLTSIDFPESLKTITSASLSTRGAFYYCTSLKSVTFGDNSALTTIGDYAFYQCTSLTNIEIPSTVTSIGTYAFYSCTGITSVTSKNTTPPTVSSDYTFNTIYSTATLYAASADYLIADYWEDFETIYVTSSGSCGDNLTYTLVVDDNGCSLTIEGYGDMYDYSSASAVPWYGAKSLITGTNVSLPEGMTSIGDHAFHGCSKMKSIDIPETVTSIGDCAFCGCGITSIDIHEAVTCIGDSAFHGCSSLESIEIPESVTTIGDYAFKSCSSLTSVTIDDDSELTSIGNYAFYNCTSLTTFVVPSKVTTIGNYAFYGCTALAKFTSLNPTPPTCYAYTLSSIGSSFQPCSLYAASYDYLCADYWSDFSYFHLTGTGTCGDNLTWTIEMSGTRGTLTIEGSGDMYDYSSSSDVPWYCAITKIKSISFSEGVTSIGTHAFNGFTKLTSVTFEDDSELTTIGNYAFYKCTALTSIEFPSTVTSIGDYTFYGCTKLASATFENNSELTTIGKYTFYNCTSLTSIEFPSTTTSIGTYAFSQCTGLTSVTSYNLTPPTAYASTFSSTTYSSATLYAPSSDYETATCWTKFYTIIAIPIITVDEDGYTKAFNDDDIDFTELVTYNPGEAEITITYIEIDSDGNETGTETTSQPTEIGSYKVTISVAETETSTSASAETTLTVTKATSLASLDNASDGYTIYYGSDEVDIESDVYNPDYAEITITYKDEDGNSYTEQPTAVGVYTVYIAIAETDYYYSKTITTTLTIRRRASQATYTATTDEISTTYGTTVDFTSYVDNPDNAEITIVYVDSDGNESSDYPTEVGTYTVIITVSETDDSEGTSFETTLVIAKAASTASMSTTSYTITYGDDPVDIEGDITNPANAEISIAYDDENGNSYSTQPTDAGEYDVVITIAETDNYEGGELTATLTINKATSAASLDSEGYTITFGDDPVDIESDITNPANAEISIAYVDENGNSYSMQPTDAGEYDVVITIAETDNYEGDELTTTLTINKADCPATLNTSSFAIIYGSDAADIESEVNNPADAEISIVYIDENQASTSEQPTDVGAYDVLIYVSETTNYTGCTLSATLTIVKSAATATIDVSSEGYSITYGDDAFDFTELVSGNDVNATVTVTYEIDGATTTEQPTAAGTYKVVITVEATSITEETSAETTLTINKATSTASLNSEGYTITYGDDPVDIESDITNPANAEISIAYVDADGNSYSTQPTDAGEYDVAINIAETDNYESDELTTTLTINKAESQASLNSEGYTITYGDDPVDIESDITNPANDEISIAYVDENGNSYNTQPTDAGEYDVVITIAETDNYEGGELTTTLTINKAESQASLNSEGYTITYGDDPVDIESDITNPANAEISIAYDDENGNSYSTQPTDAGEYDVVITIAETDNYEGDELTATLTIEKAQPTLTISVDDICEGETLSVDVETNSDGEQTLSFTDESGNETTDEPTAAGNYSVIVNIAESDNYLAASDTATFSIMAGNAIKDIAAEASTIRTVGNTIVITSPTRATAKVVSLSGIVIKEVIVYQGETQIEMAHGGVYIVLLSDGTKAKVLIK